MTTNENENNISLTDLVKWQDDLKRDIDFSKSDDEMSPEELVKKMMYLKVDEMVEESLGKEKKADIDEMRRKMEILSGLQAILGKLIELGKEIEKNFVWQGAWLINHFDKSKDNHYYVLTRAMTDDAVGKKDLSNLDRVNLAKQVLGITKNYREKVVKELSAKQEIISALLPALEKNLNEMDFDLFGKELYDNSSTDPMKLQFQEWLTLSKKLFNERKKGIEAVDLDIDLDEMLPKYIIENNGDVTKNLSGMEMKVKGDRVVRLISEADKAEKEIGAQRDKLSVELYGAPESYMEFNKETTKEQNQQPTLINPLQDKAWFRLAKVVYIVGFVLALLFSLAIMSGEGDVGFWFVVGTVILFTIIKKAFYYIVLGKTSWK